MTTTSSSPPPPSSSPQPQLSLDDTAYFLQNSLRPVILVKVPKHIMSQLEPIFSSQNPQPLFQIESPNPTTITDGCIISTITPHQSSTTTTTTTTPPPPIRFKLHLSSTPNHPKSRLLSADIGPRAENVRFEGIIQQTATLMPIPNQQYIQLVSQRSKQADTKTRTVKSLSLAEQAKQQVEELNNSVENQQISMDVLEDDEQILRNEEKQKKRTREEAATTTNTTTTTTTTAEQPTKRHKKITKQLTLDEIRKRLLDLFHKTDPATGQVITRWSQKDIRLIGGMTVHQFKSTLDSIAIIRDGKYELKPELRGTSSSS